LILEAPIIPHVMTRTLGILLAGLDDLAFYDDVLSASQVAALAAGTITPMGVPEPSIAILGGLGLLGLLRRKR
jgi:hypothetical protein